MSLASAQGTIQERRFPPGSSPVPEIDPSTLNFCAFRDWLRKRLIADKRMTALDAQSEAEKYAAKNPGDCIRELAVMLGKLHPWLSHRALQFKPHLRERFINLSMRRSNRRLPTEFDLRN